MPSNMRPRSPPDSLRRAPPPSYRLYEARPLPPLPTERPEYSLPPPPPPGHSRSASHPTYYSPRGRRTSFPLASGSGSPYGSPLSSAPSSPSSSSPSSPSLSPGLLPGPSSLGSPPLRSNFALIPTFIPVRVCTPSKKRGQIGHHHHRRVSRPPSSLSLDRPLEPLTETADVVDTSIRTAALMGNTRTLTIALEAAEDSALARVGTVRAMCEDVEARAQRRAAVLARARAVLE